MSRPAVYIDKDVVFDYAHFHLFGEGMPRYSVELVERVRSDKVVGYVAPDVIFAFYNHCHYKLRRPSEYGGRGLSWDQAEQQARDFTWKTFGTGSWETVSLTTTDLRAALQDTRFGFEDAVQFHAAQTVGVPLITWNVRHFQGKGLPVQNPKEFLASLRKKRRR
jgi:hypothetical protein